MKLRFLLSMLLLLGSVSLTGCSSSEDEAASGEEVAADESAGEESSDLEASESEEGEEVATEEGAAEEGAAEGEELDEELADTDLEAKEGEEATEEVAAADKKESADDLEDLENADFGDGEEGAATDVAAAEPPAPEEPATEEASTEESEESTDVASNADDSSTETFASEDTGMAEAKTWVPVKKIKEVPFEKNGVWANAVYIARPGDDLASISQKIYNEDKSGDLLKVNPNLSAGVKTGDKVYYNSPMRPEDHDRMLTYYEDKGVTPQTYIAKAGDNIRSLSKQWLGDEGSWKEVWATNAGVESKDILPEGTEIKYWTSDEGGMPVAAAEPAMPPPTSAPEMPAVDLPPPPTQASNTLPPPTMPDTTLPPPTAAVDTAGTMPGTVGGDVPPPPGMGKKKPGKDIASAGADKNMKFMMLAGVVVAIGMLFLVIARRKSAKRNMGSINAHTQV